MTRRQWRRAARETLGTLTIVGGLIYGGIELRNLRQIREREATLELARLLQSPELTRGLLVLYSLPDSLSANDLREHVGDELAEITNLGLVFESLGLLIYRREVSLESVNELFSTPIRVSWRKLNRYYADRRVELGSAAVAEWFQWLVERLEENYPAQAREPAYRAHAAWKP